MNSPKSKKPCTLVALDTSSYATGYAVYKNAKFTQSGVIDLHKDKQHWEHMPQEIVKLLKRENPDILVVEQTTMQKNPDTLRKLSEIVGVAMGWALTNNADFIEMLPSEWRKAICEEGEKVPAKKENFKTLRDRLKDWSKEKVFYLFHKDVSDDESDAILIGLAWINKTK